MVIIPGQFFVGLLLVATLPLTLTVATVVDLILLRWRLGTARIIVFITAYMWIGVFAQLWSAMTWLHCGFGTRLWSPQGQYRSNKMIKWWIESMMVALRVVGLNVRYEGQTPPAGVPIIVAGRHQSMADVYIPTRFVLDQNRHVRIVLAAGLRNEPALDMVGHRTPQYFVQRQGSDMRAEVAGVFKMATASDASTGLVIFPEGGLSRPKLRQRIIDRLEESRPDLAERARAMQHLMAPRLAGFSAMLDGSPDADVVILAHVGFDRLTDPATIWRSVPLRHEAVVHTWYHPRATVPTDADALEAWLFDQWQRSDDWISAQMQLRGSARVNK